MRKKPLGTIVVCTADKMVVCATALLHSMWKDFGVAKKREGTEYTRAAKSLKTIFPSAPEVTFYRSDARPRSLIVVLVIAAMALMGTAFAQNTSYQRDPKWQVP